MKRNKKIIVSIAIVILVISVTLVISYIYRDEKKTELGTRKKTLNEQLQEEIKKKYPEWMKTLDIPDEKIIGYQGICGYEDGPINSDLIALNIDDSKGKLLKDLVQKDNDFIKENSEKFDNNLKRMLYYGYRRGEWPCAKSYGYKNFFDESTEPLELDIKIDGSMKIGFALENIMLDEPIIDNVEVLEIYRDKKSISSDDHKDRIVYPGFLLKNRINDLRYIILLDFAEGTDKKLEEEIKSNYPDVKIYQVNTKNKEQ